jgi:peptidyl-prolyl cis-trans isomerase SurA
MKKTFLSTLLLCASMAMFAQADQVLMTINDKPIMASEFLYIYEKNNQESSLEKKTMNEYLDLFINFKLKVAEAIAQGVDTTDAFKKELAGYRAQATPKYLQDNEAIDSLVELSYNRMAKLRRASHIAVQCAPDADEATVAAAQARIDSIRERVTVGLPTKVKKGRKTVTVQEVEDFNEAAVLYSEEPSAKQTRGELGWIQPFRYVYSFEDAVYTTPVGEVTPVFRSPYGFHIAKVQGLRDFEEVHAAHIMKMTPAGDLQRMLDAQMAMDSIYALLTKDSADFAALAQAHSEDRGSAMRGGDLGWFGRGAMVQPFEDITFDLEENQISKPFQTRYGIHISKLYAKRDIQPLDSMRSDILRKVQRDQRMQIAHESFIRKTRAEYNLPAEMTDAEVKAYADAHLEEKYSDLRNLVNEYHDGILLFDVSLREVWDKASQDVEGLTAFFKENKKNYVWDEPRFKGHIIYAKDETAAKVAKQIVKTADPDSVMSYLNQRVNVDSVMYAKIERGIWTKGKSSAIDKYGFKVKETEYTPNEDYPIVIVLGKVIKAPQVYTDDRGKVVTDYQDYLEKTWVANLRNKYSWKINQDVWNSIKK